MLNPRTAFIYDGINVNNVQNPQFCARCVKSNAHIGTEVDISFHGTFID